MSSGTYNYKKMTNRVGHVINYWKKAKKKKKIYCN